MSNKVDINASVEAVPNVWESGSKPLVDDERSTKGAPTPSLLAESGENDSTGPVEVTVSAVTTEEMVGGSGDRGTVEHLDDEDDSDSDDDFPVFNGGQTRAPLVSKLSGNAKKAIEDKRAREEEKKKREEEERKKAAKNNK